MSVAVHSRLVVVSTLQVFFFAFLLSYFNVEIPLLKLDFLASLKSRFPRSSSTANEKTGDDNTTPRKSVVVLTPKQLSRYDGSENAPGLYLALLGKIYDVSKGSKHYGSNGGYHFFAGKDATRSFVTGDFTATGLVDDIFGLSLQDLIGIEDWVQFYAKEYTEIGYLHGTYYDAQGRATNKLNEALKLFQSARKWQQGQMDDLERFPSCNSEWVQGKGGRVWCSNKSGGVTREWTGVPRKLFTPGNGQSRCACVKESGSAQDLDTANLRLYDNCDPKAVSCNI